MGNNSEKSAEEIKVQVEQRLDGAPPGAGEGSKLKKEMSPAELLRCLAANVKGDGILFVNEAGEEFIFNAAMGVWLYWAGHHWKIDKTARAMAAVSRVADVYEGEKNRLNAELKKLDDDDPAKAKLKKKVKNYTARAFTLLDTTRSKRVLEMAAAGEGSLSINGDEIDQKPWLFALKNGVINLKTGELEPGRQTDYQLKNSPVSWAGINEPAPIFLQTLDQVFSGNQALIDFLQRCVGMAMIGKVVSNKLIVLVGQGRNGKSLLMELFSKVLGQLSGSIRPEMLLDSGRLANPSGPSPELMALRGVRLAVASETDENCRISTARVKWLTGGDTMVARGPHDKYEVQFRPSHTLFLLTNHKPHAPADDFAFWERVILIPFENSFVDRDPKADNEFRADPNLQEKLEGDLPGILAWMVRGCLLFQQYGLNPPAIVTNAVSEYKQGEDSIGDFIDACCVVGDGFSVPAAAVYQVFEEWWKKNISNKIPKQKRFGAMFGRRFEKRKTPNVTYFGVKLADKRGN